MVFVYIVPRQQSGSSGSASSTATSTSTTAATSSTTTSAASLATTPPTNTAPFFPDPSTRIEPQNEKSDLTKTVLEWVFVVFIILIVLASIIYRLTLLHMSNRPLRDFFRLRRRLSRSSYLASHHPQYLSSSYPYSGSPYPSRSYDISNIPLPLANVPSSHQLSQLAQLGNPNVNTRRTTAVNVDEGGRRLDSRPNPEDEGAEDWDREKDALPAYDKYGGPPGYLEAGMAEGGVGMTRTWRVGPLGLLHARPSSRGDGEEEPQTVTTATGGVTTHANFTEDDANPSSTPMAASPLTVPPRVYEPTAPAPALVHANSESRSDS